MKRLIVNADDLGQKPDAIPRAQHLAQKGRLTSISIMTDGPAVAEALALEDLDIGFHLELGRGRPKQEVLSTRWGRGEVESEFARQFEVFARAGVRPTHFDGHYHIHIFPGVVEIVARLAAERGIPWVRCPVEEPIDLARAGPRRDVTELFLRHARAARDVFASHGLKMTEGFRGLALVDGMTAEDVVAVVSNLPEGATEFMIHPHPADAISLRDPRVGQALAQHGVVPSRRCAS